MSKPTANTNTIDPKPSPVPFNYAAAAARSSSSSRPGSGAQTPNPNLPSASSSLSSSTTLPPPPAAATAASTSSATSTPPAPASAWGATNPNGANAVKNGTSTSNGASVPVSGAKLPSAADKQERRTSTVGVKGHNVRPSQSSISFGSLADDTKAASPVISSSPANPPTLSKRDGPPVFGTGLSAAASSEKKPAAAEMATPPTSTITIASASPAPTPSGAAARKKKYDFNSGFQATAPSFAPPPGSNASSSPSPSLSYRPDPPRNRGNASTYDPSAGGGPGSPRPGSAHPPQNQQGNFGGSHLSGASQVFTPGGAGGRPSMGGGYGPNGGPPGWNPQQGPPHSPHFAPGQLPQHMQQQGYPNGPAGGYMGPPGQQGAGGKPPFSPRNSVGPGGPPPGSPHFGSGGRPLAGNQSQRGGGQGGPTSPRMSHAGPNGTPNQPGFGALQGQQGPPGGGPAGQQGYWNGHPPPQQQGYGPPPGQGGYPYGYHPQGMPTYPNPNHQQPPPPQQQQQPLPHFQPQQQQMPQPSPGTLHQPLPPPGSSSTSGGSTPNMQARQVVPPSPGMTPSTPTGYSMAPPGSAAGVYTPGVTGPAAAQQHGRQPSLSYNAPSFSPVAPAPHEFKPNPAAVSFTPRKSAAIRIVKPAVVVETVKEEEEKALLAAKEKEEREVEEKEAEEKKRKEEEEAAAEKKKKEDEEEAAEKKRLEEKKAAEEAAAAAAAAAEAEKKRKEVEEAEAKAKADKEAKDKAEKERLVKEAEEAKAKADKEAKEKEEAAKAEKEKKDKEEKEAAENKAKEAAEAAAAAASTSLPDPGQVSGLPSKPVNGSTASAISPKGPRPSPIDVVSAHSRSRTVSGEGIPSALPSALHSARKIEDLNQVSYPENISSPRPELNPNAQAGKFRYDRDFLLQFMEVCKERPTSLPALESIGMTDSPMDAFTPAGGGGGGGGFSRSQSFTGQRRGPAGGAPPLSRGVSGSVTPIGSGPIRVGSGGVPTFGRTSEERFQQASMRSGVMGGMPIGSGFLPGRPAGGQMSRPPSMSGIVGGREGGRQRSERGRQRGGKGSAQAPPTVVNGEPIAPLQASANSWGAARGNTLEEDSPEMVNRKVKALLNKLTLDKFDSISNQVLVWANKSERETDGRILRQVIALIFEKATDEAHWSEMYARLCRMLMECVSAAVKDEGVKDTQGNPVAGGNLFRKYLLNRCQEDYERGWSKRDELAAIAADKAAEDSAKQAANEKSRAEAEAAGSTEPPKEAELLSDEYYAAQKAKRQGLGLVRFIGELFKLSMLTERIMHECIKKLLSNIESPEEEDIESLCRLMSTVGKLLDHDKALNHMNVYFSRMKALSENMKLSSRARFMVQDIIDTRRNGWIGRNEAAGPKLISEIHQEAAKAAADAARRPPPQSKGHQFDSMPRGGSRGGQRRDQFAGVPGPDGWNHVGGAQAPPPRPTKAGDLTNFGKIRDGAARVPTFGPSSVFANKIKKDGKATPDREATIAAANPFALLTGDAPGADLPPLSLSRRSSATELATGSAGSRPKLQLAPRTLPIPNQVEENAEKEQAEEAKEPEISDETVARMVKNSVDEFFNVKSVDEAVSSFEGLPPSRRYKLVAAMAEKAMDKKIAEVQLTASLFKKLSGDMVVKTAFIKAFEPIVEQLDDLGVDNPSAFKFCGILLKASALDEAAVKEMSEKMESMDDLDEAKEKLMNAFKNAPAAS